MIAIKEGDICPKFSLKNQHGVLTNVEDFIGKQNLVIYFYPKDDTPACTKEACSFRDAFTEFQENDCEVIGISSDSELAHKKFAERHKLPFTLLADTKKTVRNLFGVPGNLFGLIPGRVTYIIDKNGVVKGVFNSQMNPVGHITEALKLVKTMG